MKRLILLGAIAMASTKGWAVATVNLSNYGTSANPIYFLNGALLPVEGAYVQLLLEYVEYGSGKTYFAPVFRENEEYSPLL